MKYSYEPNIKFLKNYCQRKTFVDWSGPNGIRIRVYALKGRRPRPLDDGAIIYGDYG